jgi:hypothetical protein
MKDLKDLPSIQGLLSYSKDVDKLYLSNGSEWDAIATEKQVESHSHSFMRSRAAKRPWGRGWDMICTWRFYNSGVLP